MSVQRLVGNRAAASVVVEQKASTQMPAKQPQTATGAALAKTKSSPTKLPAQERKTGPKVGQPELAGAGPDQVEQTSTPRDARLEAFKTKAKRASTSVQQQPGPAAHVRETQDAAAGPANERMAGAKASQVADMDGAPAGKFDKAAFVAAVDEAIRKRAPTSLEGADELASSGAMASVKADVNSQVAGSTTAAKRPVEQATAKPADPSRGQAKQPVPMKSPVRPKLPSSVGAAAATPSPRVPAETNLDAEPAQVATSMAAEGVTEEQLAASEEPAFIDALAAKRAADGHSRQAPSPVKVSEQQELRQATAKARTVERTGLKSFGGLRASSDEAVSSTKSSSKAKDEGARQRVANAMEQIHATTQAETTSILDGLDKLVDAQLDAGEAQARKKFEQAHQREMDAWKDDRYDGWTGSALWLKDKVLDPPAETVRIFERARALYLREMRVVVEQIAATVGRELARAKQRIASGRTELDNYVASLPQGLRAIGSELAGGIQAKFDALRSEVAAKQSGLVNTVAARFVEASNKIDARVADLKAANRGLWGAAKSKISGAFETIRALKDGLISAFKGAGQAVAMILSRPKRFFDNLSSAIGDGLGNFVKNIGGHLKKGMIGWLTGTLSESGIQVPETFDLKGIIGLVLQVLGLTWGNIRSRIVAKLGPRGEQVLGHIETGMEIVSAVAAKGPIALWNIVAAKVTNLWDMVVGKLEDFLITKVISAGVQWLVGLLNPVAGFIKISKAIVDLVTWFMNNAGRVTALLRSITGSIVATAKGSTEAAAEAIEGAMARTLPIAIGFLASLLGLGGVGAKVQEVIRAVRSPVTKVVDGVIAKAVKMGRKILNSSLGAKLLGGTKRGLAYGKKKLNAAKSWGAKKARSAKSQILGGDDSKEGRQERLRLALNAGVNAVNKYSGKRVGRTILDPMLELIRARRGIGYLGITRLGAVWAVQARIDRNVATKTKHDGDPQPKIAEGLLGPAVDKDGKPLAGRSGEYRSLRVPKDARSHSALVVFREHIIPRSLVSHLVSTMTHAIFPGGARALAGDTVYTESPVILMYATGKKAKDAGDARVKTAFEGKIANIVQAARKQSSTNRKIFVMETQFQALLRSELAPACANEATAARNSDNGNAVRGTTDITNLSDNKIDQVVEDQALHLMSYVGNVANDVATLTEDGVPHELMLLSLQSALRGSAIKDAGGRRRFSIWFGLGRDGGEGPGIARLLVDDKSWGIYRGRKGSLVSDGSVSKQTIATEKSILAAAHRLRLESASSVYDKTYRSKVIAVFKRNRKLGAGNDKLAVGVALDSVELPSRAGRRPGWQRVVKWAKKP